jgi:hypothetical protein
LIGLSFVLDRQAAVSSVFCVSAVLQHRWAFGDQQWSILQLQHLLQVTILWHHRSGTTAPYFLHVTLAGWKRAKLASLWKIINSLITIAVFAEATAQCGQNSTTSKQKTSVVNRQPVLQQLRLQRRDNKEYPMSRMRAS